VQIEVELRRLFYGWRAEANATLFPGSCFGGGDFAALGPVGRCEEALFLSFTITFVLLTALFAVVQPCLIGSGAVRGQQQIVLTGAVAQI
jgi:hypothetical protein